MKRASPAWKHVLAVRDRITKVAARISRSYKLNASQRDDLIQFGTLHAHRAAKRYLKRDKHENTATFWTFASKAVYFAMTDYLQGRFGEVGRRQFRAARAEGRPITHVPFVDLAIEHPFAAEDWAGIYRNVMALPPSPFVEPSRRLMESLFAQGMPSPDRAWPTKSGKIIFDWYLSAGELEMEILCLEKVSISWTEAGSENRVTRTLSLQAVIDGDALFSAKAPSKRKPKRGRRAGSGRPTQRSQARIRPQMETRTRRLPDRSPMVRGVQARRADARSDHRRSRDPTPRQP